MLFLIPIPTTSFPLQQPHSHSHSNDLIPIPQVSLKQVAVNGMKQYVRSRNQPAPESVKRAKQLPYPLPTHPLFSEGKNDKTALKSDFSTILYFL